MNPELLAGLTKWLLCGMALNVFGFLLLFRYGAPYPARTGGAQFIVTRNIDEGEKRRERWFDLWSWLGVVTVLVGYGLQAWASGRLGGLW